MLTALVVALTLAHPTGPPPPAECKTAFGRTACGYNCIAAYGEVRCAQTPEGRCQAAYGEITCWDPELDRPQPYRNPPQVYPTPPQSQCVNAYGRSACGYDCRSAFGEVRCAKTPQGVCHAAFGRLVCWDPPRYVPGGEKAHCEAAFGEIACGYGCVAAYGKIKCAASPGGACTAAYGEVTCSE